MLARRETSPLYSTHSRYHGPSVGENVTIENLRLGPRGDIRHTGRTGHRDDLGPRRCRLTDRGRAGVLGGMMNFAGNIGGILVPIIVGIIVQLTGSYFFALMFFTASAVLYTVSSLIIDYSKKLPV